MVVFLTQVYSANQPKPISCDEVSTVDATKLNSSFAYYFDFNSEFCIVTNTQKRIIGAGSSNVYIKCTPRYPWNSTNGIVFINSTVEIENISFIGCGACMRSLPQDIIKTVNESSLYYSGDHAVAFLFINCKVIVRTVHLKSSFGFGIIGFNLNYSLFDSSIFSSSVAFSANLQLNKTIGSGFLIHFTDQCINKSYVNVQVNKCCFENNHLYIRNSSELRYSKNGSLVSYAAGLTIIYSQKNYQAFVNISSTIFSRNFGPLTSSLLIIHYNEGCCTSYTLISKCDFYKGTSLAATNNISQSSTSEMSFMVIMAKQTPDDVVLAKRNLDYVPLLMEGTEFHNLEEIDIEQQKLQKRAIAMYFDDTTPKMMIKLNQVKCSNNSAILNGVCMYVEGYIQYRITIVLDSVTIVNNGVFSSFPIAGMITLRSVKCIVNGSEGAPSAFENNYGTAIVSINSIVELHGYVLFNRNKAIDGPAISARGNSRIRFMEHSAIEFIRNKALKLGGAIYAVVSEMNNKNCAFDFKPDQVDSWKNNISFVNNSAEDGGNSIYASPLFNCHVASDSSTVVHSIQTYNSLFKFTNYSNQIQHNISTLPEKLIGTENIEVYPGIAHTVCFQAKDFINRNVYASVQTTLRKAENVETWLIIRNEKITEKETCTNITITFYVASNKTDFVGKSELVFFYLQENYNAYLKVLVTIKQCSIGFILDKTTGSCACSMAFHYYDQSLFLTTDCQVATQSFHIPIRFTVPWVGTVDNGTNFAISTDCFIGQCELYSERKILHYIANSSNIELVNYDGKILPICAHGREGVLCSKCIDGLSVVIGSMNCQECPNYLNYWLFIIIHLIAGPVLILIIYLLNLTLATGTMNGVIFYANVINVSFVNILYINNSSLPGIIQSIQIKFIYFLNLKVPFPICIYNGMNEQGAMIAGIVFPYYLLLIVLLIIIASRYSLWLSNKTAHSSLQVLVTVVHISFSSLFGSLINVFAFTTIITSDNMYKVWKHDGSIKYLQNPQHVTLVVVMSLVVLPLIIIYLFLLTLGKCLLKFRCKFHLKIRHIYEAIHAPYKEGFQYWFAAKLFLFIVLCITPKVTSFDQTNIAASTQIILFTIGFISSRPYKSTTLNILEIWILINLIALYIIAFLPQKHPILPREQGSLEFSILCVICTFIVIIVYHILYAMRLLHTINNTATEALKKCFRLITRRKKRTPLINAGEINFNRSSSSEGNTSDSYYKSYRQFREPILGD